MQELQVVKSSPKKCKFKYFMKWNEDMILTLAGQSKQLSYISFTLRSFHG